MNKLLPQIEQEYPKALKYFYIFLNESDLKIDTVDFEALPFEYQLGVFVKFFDTINSDIQLYATDMEVLQESVIEAFATYEEYLFLDS